MTRIKPMFRFQLSEHLLADLIFISVNFLIIALIFIAPIGFMRASYNGYCISCCVYTLMVVPSALRCNMRLGAQLGVSRRTTFVSFLLHIVASAAVLSVVGECILTAASTISSHFGEYSFSDLYPMLFLDGTRIHALSLEQHLLSVLFHFSVILLCATIGTALSMLLWRLNRLGQIVLTAAAASIPLWLPFLLIGIASAQIQVPPLILTFFSTPSYLMGLFLISAAVLFCLSWIWGNTVNVRAEK